MHSSVSKVWISEVSDCANSRGDRTDWNVSDTFSEPSGSWHWDQAIGRHPSYDVNHPDNACPNNTFCALKYTVTSLDFSQIHISLFCFKPFPQHSELSFVRSKLAKVHLIVHSLPDGQTRCHWFLGRVYLGSCWLLAVPTAANTFTNLMASVGLGPLPLFATHSLQSHELLPSSNLSQMQPPIHNWPSLVGSLLCQEKMLPGEASAARWSEVKTT